MLCRRCYRRCRLWSCRVRRRAPGRAARAARRRRAWYQEAGATGRQRRRRRGRRRRQRRRRRRRREAAPSAANATGWSADAMGRAASRAVSAASAASAASASRRPCTASPAPYAWRSPVGFDGPQPAPTSVEVEEECDAARAPLSEGLEAALDVLTGPGGRAEARRVVVVLYASAEPFEGEWETSRRVAAHLKRSGVTLLMLGVGEVARGGDSSSRGGGGGGGGSGDGGAGE